MSAVLIPAVFVDHPEVRIIQPTWHCLKRFRERHRSPLGTQAALDGLAEALREADVTTRPPRGIAPGANWSLYAVHGALAFPLIDEGGGRFLAPTCLTATRRR